MTDDRFSDWGDYVAPEPKETTSSTPASSRFADWSNDEDLQAKGNSSDGMGYLDPIKGAAAGAVGDVAAAATGVQFAAEKAGYPTVAGVARNVSSGLHRAEKVIEDTITPEGKAAQGAALIPNEDQEQLLSHPVREVLMKGAGVAAPAAVGVVGGTLGAMLAGPAGAAAGTAGAGALYGLAKGVDQAVAWTNDLNDEDLAKEAPVFGKFKQMYLEENLGKGLDQAAAEKRASYDARVALHDGLYGIKQAAFDAGTNALAFGAGRKVLSGLGGSRLTDYVLSGGSLGAVSASSDVNQQNVEITKKGEGQVNPFQTAIAFLNGTAEGIAFHGAGEGAKKLAKWAGFDKDDAPPADNTPRNMSRDMFAEKQAVNTPASNAPTTGEVPKGARTGEPPKPNEAAQEGQIGNTVNPPTRDQGTPAADKVKATSKARGKKVDASVTVLDDSTPPAAELEALQKSTAGAPDTVQLAEPPKPAPVPTAETPAENQAAGSIDADEERNLSQALKLARGDGWLNIDVQGVGKPYERDATLDPLDLLLRHGYADAAESLVQRWESHAASAKSEKNKQEIGAVATEARRRLVDYLSRSSADSAEPAPVTQEVSPATEVPEADPTIDSQVNDFFDKKRDVIRFNNPNQVPELPESQRVGVREHKGSDGSVWWHRPRKVPQGKIEQAIKGKTENELLGLGPYTKEDVQADVAAGGQEMAAVARDENGVETAAAATTDRLASDTVEALQEANPGKTVTLEQPEQVIEGRLNGTGAVEAPADPNAFDEALARREVEEQLRTAQPRIGDDGRRILPPAPTEENIRAGVETRHKEWQIEQEKAAAEERRAKRDLEEEVAAEKENAPPAPPADFKSQKNPARDRKRAENRDAADTLFNEQAPSRETKGRAAIIERANKILAAAKERGITIPSKLDYEKHSAGQAFLKEAQILASKARAALKTPKQFPSAEDFDRFAQAEFDLRDGLEGYDRYKKNARAEGDAKFGVKFNEKFQKGAKAKDERTEVSGELEMRGEGDEFSRDDTENEGQAKTLADAAVDREVEEYEEPKPNDRPTVELKGDEVVAAADKSADIGTKIKVETRKSRTITRPGKSERASVDLNDPYEALLLQRIKDAERELDKLRSLPTEEMSEPELDRHESGISEYEDRLALAKGDLAQLKKRKDFTSALESDETGTSKQEKITAKRTSKLSDELSSIAGRKLGPFRKFIVKQLQEIVGDVQVHIVNGADLTRIAREPYESGTVRGLYTDHPGQGPRISIAEHLSKQEFEEVLIHEAMHALSHRALARSAEFRHQLNVIKDTLLNHLKAKGINPRSYSEEARPFRYGFTDSIDEFLSEAWGNKVFHEELDKAQLSEGAARELGIRDWRGKSLWYAFVEKVRNAFTRMGIPWPKERVSALEGIIKVTEEIAEYQKRGKTAEELRDEELLAGMASLPSIDFADTAKRMIDRLDTTNAKDLYGKFKRGAASNTMLAMIGQKLGPKFGYYARKAVQLQQEMAVRTDNILRRKGGGLEMVREGDELRKAKPEMMQKAFDLGFEAREYDLDMTPGAKNEHIFGTSAKSDILNATQAKKAYGRLRAEIDALDPDVRSWLERSAKFFREEDNNTRMGMIRRVLDTTDADKQLAAAVARGDISRADGTMDALAQRIFDSKMTDKDKDLFKTDKVVNHLNDIAGLKRLKGWYFPQERKGDYTLGARREVPTPTGSHAHAVSTDPANNTFTFTDPRGANSDARARRAAQEWARELVDKDFRATIKKVFVLQSDPTKIISNEEAGAIGAPPTLKAYKVEVMNEFFDLFEDPASRNAKRAELEKDGWINIKNSVRQQNPNARWDGMVPSQFATLISSLQSRDKFKGMTPGQQNELLQALSQSATRLLPGARIQHHNLQSRNVAGYNRNIINVLAKSAEESARFQAKTEFMPKISEMLKSAKDEIDLNPYSKRAEDRQLVLRDLETRLLVETGVHHEGFINKTLDTLNKVSIIDKLFGPSFHIINIQEPALVAAPVVGGRHGFVRTARAMKDAYNMIGGRTNALVPAVKDTWRAIQGEKTNFSDYRANFKAEIAKNISGERGVRLSGMLDMLHDSNLLGHEAGMEVARLADPAAGRFMQALDRVDLVSRQVGQAIEAINRAVTGLTAYELEYARNKGNHQAAMRYAHDVVHDTMGNYSASNSAPVFNHPVGRAMLQFKKYAQKTYFLLGKMAGRAYEGDRESQKALLGVLFTHGVVAGALGMPIEPIKAAAIVSNALGISPYSWDEIEAAIRDEAATLLGKKVGTAVTRGVPRAFLGYDASGRQGLADLTTGLGPRSSSSSDIKSWLFDTIMGPSLGMPFKMMEGAQKSVGNLAKGDVSGAAREALDVFPVKFVRDFARAGYGAVEGRKNNTGRELMAPYSPFETAVQMAGFTPSRRADEAEMRSKFNAVDQHRKHERRGLIADWVTATPEGKRDAMAAIQKYNQTVPGNARIQQSDLQSELKRRKTEKAKGGYDRGMRITKQNRDIHDRMNQVYGD